MKYTAMVQGYKYRIDGTDTRIICVQGKNNIPGQEEIQSQYKAYNMDFEVIEEGPSLTEELICQGFMTGEDLLEIVIDYMKKSPDNVYGKVHPDDPGCFYTKGECSNGSIGCVFGQVLTMLGFPMKMFDDGTNSPNIHTVCNSLGILSKGETVAKLVKIQQRQDKLFPWGECIKDI